MIKNFIKLSIIVFIFGLTSYNLFYNFNITPKQDLYQEHNYEIG